MEEIRQRVVRRFREVWEAREPRHEIIWALMGDAEGTVEVPGQEGKVYCRLYGRTSLTVRAWNRAVPRAANLRVEVEVLRQKGMPDDYFVLSLSRVGYGGYGGQDMFYLPPHGETHEYDPAGLGSDIVNVYKRALTELRADAQATPDMTLLVSAGYYLAAGLEYFTGGTSPTFSAAPATGERYDLLYLDADTGLLAIREGTAGAPGFATRPQPQEDEVPIAWARIEAGDTAIVYTAIIDARVTIVTMGAQGAVLAHPLDPSGGVHTGELSVVWQPLTNGDPASPALVFADGDVVMVPML